MGAKWQRIRSILNPRMLKPQHVSSYSNTINEVVTDFLEKLVWLRAKDGGGVMVHDVAGELYKFAFEGQTAQPRGARCLNSPPLPASGNRSVRARVLQEAGLRLRTGPAPPCSAGPSICPPI